MGVGDKSGLLSVAPTPGRAALLTGGDFGPDGSVLASFVAGLLVVAILAVAARRSRYATAGSAFFAAPGASFGSSSGGGTTSLKGHTADHRATSRLGKPGRGEVDECRD
jgi:hypothetical protein